MSHWVGLGVRPADGINCGAITDSALAEGGIVGAIADAERAAGGQVQTIILGVGCGRLSSLHVDLSVRLDPTIVQSGDVERLRDGARTYAERDERWCLYEDVGGFKLDGVDQARAPLERFGRTLQANMSLVTADADPVGRLVSITERSGSAVVRLTPAPLAAAWAVTTEAERAAGITVVDFGAGFTSMVTFIKGRLVRLKTVTIGGRRLTQDVAAALQIPFASAERIKLLCDSIDPAHAVGGDAHEHRSGGGFITEELPVSTGFETRADLCAILSPRLDIMLRHVADHLDGMPPTVADSGRLVLTGGGSLLAGLPAYAARLLGRQVRLGSPKPKAEQSWGLAASALPALAVVAGLAEMAGRARYEAKRVRLRAA